MIEKPDAVQIYVVEEDGVIPGELWYRPQDDYMQDLADMIDSLEPGEYDLVIRHYKEIGENENE